MGRLQGKKAGKGVGESASVHVIVMRGEKGIGKWALFAKTFAFRRTQLMTKFSPLFSTIVGYKSNIISFCLPQYSN